MAGHAGKWGGAVNVKFNLAAPATNGEEIGSIAKTKNNNNNVPAIVSKIQVFDVYIVGQNPKHLAQPFIHQHQLNILSPNGITTQVQANFDDSALINAMSVTKFNDIKHRLGHYKPSSRRLCMANGAITGAIAVWEGEMEIEGVKTFSSFEVFDSRDSWELLFGKPLLTAFNAIHKYKDDTVTIEHGGIKVVLENQVNNKRETGEMNQSSKDKEQESPAGNNGAHPLKEVATNSQINKTHAIDVIQTGNPGPKDNKMAAIYMTTDEIGDNLDTSALAKLEVEALKDSTNIFM